MILQFGPCCWIGTHNFCRTAQFLLNWPLDRRDQPVTANVTTVILMEKGVNATPSRQFVNVQSPGVYCRKMRCSTVTVTETDKQGCSRLKTNEQTNRWTAALYKSSLYGGP